MLGSPKGKSFVLPVTEQHRVNLRGCPDYRVRQFNPVQLAQLDRTLCHPFIQANDIEAFVQEVAGSCLNGRLCADEHLIQVMMLMALSRYRPSSARAAGTEFR